MQSVKLRHIYGFFIFLAILAGLCYALDCKVQRLVKNTGFHRQLITSIQLEGIYVKEATNCSWMLIEIIPSGIYVDLHELKSQESHGGPQVYSTSRIDTEKPEYWSMSHEIYVWHHFVMTPAAEHELEISMPIHLRYHRPSVDHDYIPVSLGAPKLFLQCDGTNEKFRGLPGKDARALCEFASDSSNECEWREVDYVKNGNVDDYVLKLAVPVGNQNQNTVIVGGTLLFTVGGTLYLVYNICISNQNRDLIALIKAHEKAKEKARLERHFNHSESRQKMKPPPSQSEVIKEKIKSFLFMSSADKDEVTSNFRKRYK